jgi:hypothetical protein
MVPVRKMTEEKRLRDWLIYIMDIAYDHDGYHNAKDLGELVDELRKYAISGLKGEKSPFDIHKE